MLTLHWKAQTKTQWNPLVSWTWWLTLLWLCTAVKLQFHIHTPVYDPLFFALIGWLKVQQRWCSAAAHDFPTVSLFGTTGGSNDRKERINIIFRQGSGTPDLVLHTQRGQADGRMTENHTAIPASQRGGGERGTKIMPVEKKNKNLGDNLTQGACWVSWHAPHTAWHTQTCSPF